MHSAKKIQLAFFFALPFLFVSAAFALPDVNDDYTPDVTARVARISYISGDVQIRRADGQDWERAAQNLPIVEGDEIATDSNARLEIQFNSYTYLRLSENAYLKVVTLRDEGIALSLPNGSMSFRILDFDKDRAYFEVDAPKTTVSVERAGMYRIDAGSQNDSEVRVSVTDSGQARVYSENSGLTLKNGRSATVQIDGDYAGELETSDASRYADEFDSWSLQRDAVIAKRLQNADYDKYYDRDEYGAEDLSEYGDWVYTRKYGYVWKPYRNSIASYSDWSPYRYGQWRWLPQYGWTWVNDEPWGWATYHHGRWVYDSGWYWSPYAAYRSRRSWWQPALVVVSYVGSSICWYPLPYDYGYYNYNYSSYNDRRRYNTTIINNTNTTIIVNPTTPNPSPTPVTSGGGVGTNTPIANNPRTRNGQPPLGSVPATSVVSVDASDFGRDRKGIRTAPLNLAQQVLSTAPSDTVRPPVLPTIRDLNGKISKDILAANPRITKVETQIKTGATVRTSGVSTDENLRKERIFGNRQPIEKTGRSEPAETKNSSENQPTIRDTGAVKRPPRPVKQDGDNSDTRTETPVKVAPNGNPIRSTGGGNNDDRNTRNIVKPNRNTDTREPAPPGYVPPTKQEDRTERPPKPNREPVREQPQQQPRVEQPRPPSPPKSEPPPSKQEPKPEKPAPLNESRDKNKKDG